MRKQFILVVSALLIISCGGKEEKAKKFQYNAKPSVKKIEKTAKVEIPIDMNNKGIGPIKHLEFNDIDNTLVAQGKASFSQKCTACHYTEKKSTGPALKGVYKRRSPEWVMNLMLNPDEMLKKDPIAMALLKEYNNTVMLNQQLTNDEARAIAEYLRTL